jgi:single-strand DNA-binding protein
MIGINNVTIIGNVGIISDVLKTNSGNKFLNLMIATTESYYSSSKEKKTNTQWHNVILWNNMAELKSVFSKGDLVYVEGRINYRKKSTNEIFTEIVAKNIRVLSKKNHYNSSETKIDYVDIPQLDDFDENWNLKNE